MSGKSICFRKRGLSPKSTAERAAKKGSHVMSGKFPCFGGCGLFACVPFGRKGGVPPWLSVLLIAALSFASLQTAIASYSEAIEAAKRYDSPLVLSLVRRAVGTTDPEGYRALIEQLYQNAKKTHASISPHIKEAVDLLVDVSYNAPPETLYQLAVLQRKQFEGLETLKRAADAGHIEAAYEYSVFGYAKRQIDLRGQFEYTRRAALGGHALAQRILAHMYLQWQGSPYKGALDRDPEEGFRWMKLLATREDIPRKQRLSAISDLAQVYFLGIGTDRDYCAAEELYRGLYQKDNLPTLQYAEILEKGLCGESDPVLEKKVRDLAYAQSIRKQPK